MQAIEQRMTVSTVERNDGNGWEEDDGTRQVESEYSHDDALELLTVYPDVVIPAG